MKVLFSILFIFIGIFTSIAQENEANYFLRHSFEAGDIGCIYSDIANVRDEATMNSNVISRLKCGDIVRIIDNKLNKSEIVNGISGEWLKISYGDNKNVKEGYLWGGNLSRRLLELEGIKFVCGLDRAFDKEEFIQVEGQLKAISENKEIVSRQTFQSPAASYFDVSILEEPTWTGENRIIKIMIEGEACGVASINLFFVWNGKEIKDLAKTYSVGDLAYSNGYNHSERLVFPESYNEYDRIVIKYIIEDTGNYDPEYPPLVRVKTEMYSWNGNKLVLKSQNWKDNDDFQ